MKGFAVGALCAIALLVISLAVYFGLGFMDVAADGRPSGWEANWMTATVRASVRRRAGETQNPLPRSDDTLIAGGKLYMNDCVGCHGAPGQPPSEFGATFYPRAPPFPQIGSLYSGAELFWIAKHGIRLSGMYPQWRYSDADLWRLAAFIGQIRNLPAPVAKALQPVPKPD